MRIQKFSIVAMAATLGAAAVIAVANRFRAGTAGANPTPLLVTGKQLTPQGQQTRVGSFPVNMVLSPDGRYVLVTTVGSREYLTALRAGDGSTASRLSFNAASEALPKKKQGLYYGLVCGKTEGGITTLYASRGGEGLVSVITLDAEGKLTDTGKTLALSDDPKAPRPHAAGLALSGDGKRMYVADNRGEPKNEMRGTLRILNAATGALQAPVDLPGYPFAVAAVTAGPNAERKVYVTSEQRGVVSVVDPDAGKSLREIATGAQPIGLLLDRAQSRLFVANAGSDTVSIVDTKTDRVIDTVLLRPDNARGLPGATPTGLALSPDEKRLYVTMADMNAVAVVELPENELEGYLPVGWYPTAAVVSPDGRRLFVANAKGVATRNPNAKPVEEIEGKPRYIQSIIEGTVTTLDLGILRDLKPLTAQVLANNQGVAPSVRRFVNPGIRHVFYIIKENRTYDQVLGDVERGNGDPSIVMFGKEVTPNQHALADRFVLLDNFYCCAEVSGDGWNWSTGGMASEYTSRNVPHGYGGRQRPYDYEGTNNGIAVDRVGIPDVARPPGGYLWDLCVAHGVSIRNYGFFADDQKLPRTEAEVGTEGLQNSPSKKVLVDKSDTNFRQFDMNYADSDAWVTENIPPAAKQIKAYGAHNAPSRFSAWKREFDEYVKNGNLPALSMLRLPRDHTSGTTAGVSSPRAMVADNDYAVGRIVETISKSPYWKSSAIIIVEDDAQNGYDHVDAHRSIAFVVSPFIPKGSHDSRFYNTDSALRTIELLLGLPPMTQYDAIAPPLNVFEKTADNAEPYTAILPSRAILAEINAKTAYRSKDSARLLNPLVEESAPDEELNDILWRSIKGTKPPARRYALTLARRDDDD